MAGLLGQFNVAVQRMDTGQRRHTLSAGVGKLPSKLGARLDGAGRRQWHIPRLLERQRLAGMDSPNRRHAQRSGRDGCRQYTPSSSSGNGWKLDLVRHHQSDDKSLLRLDTSQWRNTVSSNTDKLEGAPPSAEHIEPPFFSNQLIRNCAFAEELEKYATDEIAREKL